MFREKPIGVATGPFGGVHRFVGLHHQIQCVVVGIARVCGDADAGGNVQRVVRDLHGQVDGLDDFGCDPRRIVGMADLGEDNDEFVAARALDRIAGANAGVEPAGDFLEQGVADIVAERVVDLLEIVEIEKHDRQQKLAALGAREGLGEAVE